MASMTLIVGGQKLKWLFFDNMHINSYVFRVADHENQHRFNINVIRTCKWPLLH